MAIWSVACIAGLVHLERDRTPVVFQTNAAVLPACLAARLGVAALKASSEIPLSSKQVASCLLSLKHSSRKQHVGQKMQETLSTPSCSE